PRQLNPEIPDAVAAILARMMAKDPRQRYQQPRELVQHLMMVAQKLGVSDLPEGVRFVESPLPTPAPKRPVLLVGAGIVGVAALVLLLSLRGPDPPSSPGVSFSPPRDGDAPGPRRKAGSAPSVSDPELDKLRQAFSPAEPQESRTVLLTQD